MANEDSITGKQFILEDMHAEANFVSVLAGDEELPVGPVCPDAWFLNAKVSGCHSPTGEHPSSVSE